MPDWQFIYDYIEVLDIEPPSSIDITPIISKIWDEVKRGRAIYTWSKITTVKGQGEYDIPTTDLSGDTITDGAVSDVYWQVRDISIDPTNILDNTEVWDVIRDVRITSMLESLDGSEWDIIAGKIYLSPVPHASGTEVAVLMYRPKTDDEITEADKSVVLEGVLWVLYERMCTQIARTSSFRAGSYAATASPSSIGYLRQRADNHRDQFKLLIDAPKEVLTV
jgi:hypothetical protein